MDRRQAGRYEIDYEEDGGTFSIRREGQAAMALNFEEVYALWALLDDHKRRIQQLQDNKLLQDFAQLNEPGISRAEQS
jgi:hypothetical protein